MKVNPNVEELVRKFIQSYLSTHKEGTITDLLYNYDGQEYITEAEFRNVIKNALAEGYLEETGKEGSLPESKLRLLNPFPVQERDPFSIVISKPRWQELGLSSLQLRNAYVESVQCFRTIIRSARQTLRICSPFIQSNVSDRSAFPDLVDLLSEAFAKEVHVFLLSRELFGNRCKELNWLIELAESLNCQNNLSIVDYHLQDMDKRVISSTHAKLLIADTTLAYIGSAELRKNSLSANFEVGCLISGPQVIGLCEIFDAMFMVGKSWYGETHQKH
jgi:phosphatidylserine/phosphatidylglycerophosphate/cardiolipin synthase-like enzyme